jgi:hypothetical protein
MIEDFIFQIVLVALIAAIWIDMAKLHKKLNMIDAYIKYIYYMLYYQQYTKQVYSQESGEEVGEAGEDAEKLKESCVLELVGRRGCVEIDEVIELCGVSKSFIINKLHRKKKLVKVDKEYKTVCPK